MSSLGSRAARKPDFGKRAAVYDELRPADENWWELYELLVNEGDLRGRRVVDVGCGTGLFAEALAREATVAGVDPEPAMLEVAAGRGLQLHEAGAERLPFPDGSFERAVMRLVVHLVDRPRAFAEARRVLVEAGVLVVATFDPSHFDDFWLNRLFPTFEAIDRARFPSAETLERELLGASFSDVRFVYLSQGGSLDRDAALDRIRGQHISTFDLVDQDEYDAGLARAEVELPDRVEYRIEWLVAVAR
ncbi:MAG: methyltransferase domain-containing protein [Actinomycetota bacterium]|nr:methyltransferase domain-containing protein [Actinomycetota bacterium]